MKYKFACPHCNTSINTSVENAGRVAKCPHCQQSFEVPAPQATTPLTEEPVQATLLPDSPPASDPTPVNGLTPLPPLPPTATAPSTPARSAAGANPFAERQQDVVPVNVSGDLTADDANPYASPHSVGQLVADTFGSFVNLQKVALGLQLVYWGLAVILLALMAGGIMIGSARDRASAEVGILVLAGGNIVGGLLGLAGRCFCAAIPAHTGARGLIMTAVIFDAASTVMGLTPLALDDVPGYLPRVASFFSLIASLLFLFFLKRVSEYIHRQDLYERARTLIILSFAIVGVVIVSVLAAQVDDLFPALGGLVMLVMGFVMLLRYVRLLVDLRAGLLELGAQAGSVS